MLKKYAAEELNYPILFSWYDAMANNGYRTHYDAVNENNDYYVKPEGKYVPAEDFFMNFNWSASGIHSTAEHMKSINRDPFDAYAGFELQANSYNTNIRRSSLVGADNKLLTSIGLFTPDSIQGLSADGEDYHEQERKFWVGFDGDPVTSDDSNRWSGMARYVADKTQSHLYHLRHSLTQVTVDNGLSMVKFLRLKNGHLDLYKKFYQLGDGGLDQILIQY